MAKVIGPLNSSEARGGVSGLIYNTWRGISYVKTFTSPAQPRTRRALTLRSFTIRAVRAWQALTGANQALWNTYAVDHPDIDWTGQTKRLTGANWFVRLTTRLLDMTLAQVNTPPVTASPDPPAAFAAADGAGSSVLSWTSPGGTDKVLDYYVVGPHSLGVLAKLERAKHYKYCNAEGATDTYTPGLAGRYTFFARILDEDNGLASTWVSDVADIT